MSSKRYLKVDCLSVNVESWCYVCFVQVDGKSLCLLCTINYKKAQFKKKSLVEQKGSSNSTSSHSSAAVMKHHRDKHSSLKRKHKDKDRE